MPKGVYRYPDAEKQVVYCACGCGERIIYKYWYMQRGYPQYMKGHNRRGRTKEADTSVAMMAEKKRGRTKENDVGVATMAEKLTGRTKESHPYLVATGIKIGNAQRGRTKKTHAYIANAAKKNSGRTKENDASVATMAEKMCGRTKETHAGVAASAEKQRGRTKETHAGIASMAEKKHGRTKENDASVAAMAEKMRGRTGDKCNAWLGGISFEPYTSAFNKALKQSIRQRDNHICQLCGVPETECIKRLSCHHIDYCKKNCSSSNLITLCHSCNAVVNGNRDYWTAYFTKKLRRKKFIVVINWIPKTIKRHQEVAHVVD